MKHLDNIYDPNRLDAKEIIIPFPGQTPEEAWAQRKQWLADKVIGSPKATECYTVEELRAMGMVGVYVADDES